MQKIQAACECHHRQSSFGDGKTTLPKAEDEYDLAKLSELVQSLKREHPAKNDASVLLEPEIEYDHLIQVMDVVRSAEMPNGGADGVSRLTLFTDISVGDAP